MSETPGTPERPAPRRRRSARRDQGPPAAAAETAPAAEPTAEDDSDGTTEDRSPRLRKRARRRATGASPMPVGRPVEPPAAAPVPPAGPFGAGRDRRVDHTERALRGLVTTRGTQVPWSAATRAREVAKPSDDDMARAADDVVIVHRNYTPPEPLRNARTMDGPRPHRRPG